jgi:hypothetical protein
VVIDDTGLTCDNALLDGGPLGSYPPDSSAHTQDKT